MAKDGHGVVFKFSSGESPIRTFNQLRVATLTMRQTKSLISSSSNYNSLRIVTFLYKQGTSNHRQYEFGKSRRLSSETHPGDFGARGGVHASTSHLQCSDWCIVDRGTWSTRARTTAGEWANKGAKIAGMT